MQKDKAYIWAMFFTSIASIRMHPRNIQEATPAATNTELEYSFDIANRMYELYEDRWGEE